MLTSTVRFRSHRPSRLVHPSIALAATLIACTSFASGSAEGSFQRTLKVTGNVNVEVSSGSGNIQVKTGSSDEVHIIGQIKIRDWSESKAQDKVHRLEENPPIQQNGNEIRIGRIDDVDLRENVSISYEITLPADCQLRANSGSGSLDIQGIRGPLDASTGSGHVKLEEIGNTVRASTGSGGIDISGVNGNVHAKAGSGSIHATGVAGGFEASTGSGDLRLEQTASGSVRVSTGSGSIDLRGVRGSLDATTGSGSLRAEGDPKGAWNLRTGSGSVDLRMPSDPSFDLNAHSNSGHVSVAFPIVTEVSNGKGDLRGKVRGGGVLVQVETGSGSIEIH